MNLKSIKLKKANSLLAVAILASIVGTLSYFYILQADNELSQINSVLLSNDRPILRDFIRNSTNCTKTFAVISNNNKVLLNLNNGPITSQVNNTSANQPTYRVGEWLFKVESLSLIHI